MVRSPKNLLQKNPANQRAYFADLKPIKRFAIPRKIIKSLIDSQNTKFKYQLRYKNFDDFSNRSNFLGTVPLQNLSCLVSQ